MAGKIGKYDAAIKCLKAMSDVTKISVINDIGDFAHVITICGHDLNLKIQIPRSDSEDPSLSLKSPYLSDEQCSTLGDTLRQSAVANKHSLELPTLLFSLAKDGVANFPVSSEASGIENAKIKRILENEKSKRGHGKQKQNKKSHDSSEKEKSKKKVAMKTAEDVVKRILWDDKIPSDDITIGYIDRFRGLQEKAFSAFSWEDIAAVDYFTFAIPKHRIQYFKYKRLIVWDKTRRLDNVFGSTGSGRTIYDEMAAYRAEDHVNDDIPASETAALKATDAPPPLTGHGLQLEDNFAAYGSVSNSESESDEMEDSDEDDGVVVTLKDRAPALMSETDDEGEDDEEVNMKGAFTKTNYWQDKTRPNFFICVRVTSPEVRAAVSHVQDVIVEREPRYESCCIPEQMLHITLCTLRLNDAEEASNCLQVMRNYATELRTSLPKAPLHIAGLDRFFHRVLYAKVHYGDDFLPFVEHLCSILRAEGIRLMDHHDFVPHMTVMKVTRPISRAMQSKFISPHVYKDAESIELGEQVIDSVYLCSMEKDRGPDGFYVSPGNITFMQEVL